MDSGEVIPGLNEDWTMAGAKLMEWMSGFIMLICAQELFFKGSPSKAMPILMLIWIGTTFGLAALRKQFPDEERGLANKVMAAVGMNPPGIPAPSVIQPVWSGCPLRELPEESEFRYLDLDKVFAPQEGEEGETRG